MHILVSGAGVAGLSAAINLGRRGNQVTLIELAPEIRTSGTPIDIRGEALVIAGEMGLRGRMEEKRAHVTDRIKYVDENGGFLADVPFTDANDSPDDLEITREDLSEILTSALAETGTEIRFGESVEALTDDGDGVDVQFTSGRTERFDLVLGADGLHSKVRAVVFGPERDYLRHLGAYIGGVELPPSCHPGEYNLMYSFPGHSAGIMAYDGKVRGGFIFGGAPIDYDHHDVEAQKKIVADAFAGVTAWRVPELLQAVREDNGTFYFDSVSQIHLSGWHRGRVALVGDAAHCSALLSGRGTSLALTGTYYLAEELERAKGDHRIAFARYESRQRPSVDFAQQSVTQGEALFLSGQ
ncbi:FAD-dependent monooxygenase [Amycolatopsis jejuensis]|uniref:FAD-dependent monooxygenase n=1 Tax=Amycolatopsis jejuensis TaxID=330084 RepID=UPI00068DF137|nr:FAD-dependent monooxygenase [Amycolatopsis jejuensis]